MSAFIMSLEGFSQLASELACRAEWSNNICDENYDVAGDVKAFLGLERSIYGLPSDAFELCRSYVAELYAANAAAVQYRYSDHDDLDIPAAPDIIRTGYWPKWSNVQLLKHLKCLSYQMSEGDVPELPIYAKLSELINNMAMSIVTNSPAYDSAAWDFTVERSAVCS